MMAAVALAQHVLPVLGNATTPSVSTSDISGIMSAVTDQFSVANITSFIAYIIGACVAFVFLWWAVRKAWRAIMAATTRGKGRI